MVATVLISLFFAVSRFVAPGHPVSAWGTWEAMAHVWMGVLLAMTAGTWLGYRDARARGSVATHERRVFGVVLACWLVPSLVELVLFLRGPFNPL